MIVKLKNCIIRFYIFYFFKIINYLQYRIFHFQVSCETAFSTIRKYGIGLQVFLVIIISKINMEFLNPLYRKTLIQVTSVHLESQLFLNTQTVIRILTKYIEACYFAIQHSLASSNQKKARKVMHVDAM